MKKSILPTIIFVSAVNGFHLSQPATLANLSPHSTWALRATKDESQNTTEKKGDNKAMSFLRKMGRVGGSANMDFANAMGLDESPSGGTKSSYHEDGFKVGTFFRPLAYQC